MAVEPLPKEELWSLKKLPHSAGTTITQDRRGTPTTGSHQAGTGCVCQYRRPVPNARSGATGK